MRQVAVAGSGAQRVPLLVGRTTDGRPCVGSGSFFRCLRAEDAEPVYVLGAFRGARSHRWGALVGLAGPETAAVTVELQDGERHALNLQRLPGFRWRSFTSPASGPNGRYPFTLLVRSRSGGEREVDMAWAAAPGTRIGDSVDAPVGESRPLMARAKRLALADARVRALLDARKRNRAYAEGTLQIKATGVDDALVQVDLTRDEVVGITPGGENVHVAEWRVGGKLRPAGPRDPATCPKGD